MQDKVTAYSSEPLNSGFKVYMKRNHFFNILKVQHFKDTISKFEPCLIKIGDFIVPENCTILLSKMVFESRDQNVLMT